MSYFNRHNDGPAFVLAMASAGTPVFGLRFSDVQWVVSVIVSMVGAAVALYIHVRNDIEAARLRREINDAEEARRQKLLDWEQRLVMREIELGHRAAPSPPAA
jgi:hypothetical protein